MIKHMKTFLTWIHTRGRFVMYQAFVPLADTPASSKLGNLYASTDLSNFVNGLFKFAIAIGAIGAVIRLAYAGYLYMGQSDMWSHKGDAKEIIGDVTLGILLLLAIYLILYQINPGILKLDALKRIKPVPAQQQSQQMNSSAPSGTSVPGLNENGSPFTATEQLSDGN